MNADFDQPSKTTLKMDGHLAYQLVAALDVGSLGDRFDAMSGAMDLPAIDLTAGIDFERTAAELSSHLWSSAYDHLRAWRNLLPDHQPLSAHATLARSSLECSVRCLWMLDAEPKVRGARAAALQLEDHRQRRNFETDAGLGEPERGMTGAQRFEAMKRAMRTANISNVRPPDLIDQFGSYALPTPSDMGKALYRLLSAFAHGYHWSLLTYRREDPPAGSSIGLVTSEDRLSVQFAEVARAALERSLVEVEELVRGR